MPERYTAALAAAFYLIICAGCADMERSLSQLTGTRISPFAMKGLTEQELLNNWGVPDSSYVDSEGHRHLSYTYESGTNYGSTTSGAQASIARPVYYGGRYSEKTDTSTSTHSSGSIIRDERTMPIMGGSRTEISQSSSGTSTSHTQSTTTGSGVSWSIADPASVTMPGRGARCTTSFIVFDGIVQDYRTTGSSCY